MQQECKLSVYSSFVHAATCTSSCNFHAASWTPKKNQDTLSTIKPGWKILHVQFLRHKHDCGFFSNKWSFVCFSQVWAESSLKCVLPLDSSLCAENIVLERHLWTCRSQSGKDTHTQKLPWNSRRQLALGELPLTWRVLTCLGPELLTSALSSGNIINMPPNQLSSSSVWVFRENRKREVCACLK